MRGDPSRARVRKMLAVMFALACTMAMLSCYACASTLWGSTPSGACGPFGHYYDGGGCCLANELRTPDGLCVAEYVSSTRDAGK